MESFSGSRCGECRREANKRTREKWLNRPTLSPTERQVADLMCLGKTNEEIGAILHRSPLTVKNHVQSIIHRLDANNRTYAAVKYTVKKIKEQI